jgi:hypothetical protein
VSKMLVWELPEPDPMLSLAPTHYIVASNASGHLWVSYCHGHGWPRFFVAATVAGMGSHSSSLLILLVFQ